MADEAVVRIVLDDSGAKPSMPPPAPPAPAPTPPAPPPARAGQPGEAKAYLSGAALPWAPPGKPIQAPAAGLRSDQAEWLRLEAEAARAGLSVKDYKKAEVAAKGEADASAQPIQNPPAPAVVGGGSNNKNAEEFSSVSDLQSAVVPVEGGESDEDIARRRKEREEARNKRLAEFPDNLDEDAAPLAKRAEVPTDDTPEANFPPLEYPKFNKPAPIEEWNAQPGSAAAKKLELLKSQQRSQPPQSSFDPMAIAKRRVEAEEKRAAVDAEYAKLKPPPPPKAVPPFDPVAAARARVKVEQQREAVDAEYRKLKPKSTLDSVLEAAEDFRGIIGGTFGRVAGVALDIAARLRQTGKKLPSPAEVPTGDGPTSPSTQATGVAQPPTATIATDQATKGAPAAVPVATTQGAEAATADLAVEAGAAAAGMSAIVPVAGAVVVGLATMASAVMAVVDEANKMANKAGEYSPEVAQAQAMVEIRQMMGDMRRANENSRQLADFLNTQSELQQQWEDVKAEIMRAILPMLTKLVKILADLLGIASRTDADEKDVDPTRLLFGGQAGIGGEAQYGPGPGMTIPGV